MLKRINTRLRRFRFLVYFFVPVALALVCGALFDRYAQDTLRQLQQGYAQAQDADLRLSADATAVNLSMLDIQHQVTQSLTAANNGQIDEAAAYALHTRIVDKVAELESKLQLLATGHDHDIAHAELQGAVKEFAVFRQFVVMSTDIIAIDPTLASVHLAQAAQRYAAISTHISNINNLVIEHAREHAQQSQQELAQKADQLQTVSLLGTLLMIAAWLATATSMAVRLDRLNISLQHLADGHHSEEDTRTFAIVTRIAQRRGTLLGDMAHAVLAFKTTLAENHAAHEALREREALYSSIVGQAPVGIVVIDLASLRFTSFNDAACNALGYTREEFADVTVYDLQADNPRELVDGRIREIIAKNGMTFENARKTKTGERRDFWISLRPLHLNGRDCLTGVWSDITERKRSERELERYRDELEKLVEERTVELRQITVDLRVATYAAQEANRAKSAFLANMSHEIRTPMNAIIGLTHLIRRDTSDEHQRQKLDKVAGAAAHLLAIINDILDFSKIEAGKMTLDPTDFEIETVVANVVTLTSERAEAKNLEIVADIRAIPPVLHGDGVRVGQILLNFVGNAVKFTEQGSVILQASVTQREGDALRIRFEVRDTGIGLTADQKDRLFAAFQQADVSTTRTHGGTGLGLAISRRLAHLMNGEVGVESVYGQGSTFWFEAPFRSVHSATHSPSHLLPPRTRVLVIDDMEEAREPLADLLRGLGARADTAASGEAALLQVAQADTDGDSYQMVFSDWQMPGLNGTQTCQRIRLLPLRIQPVCILVSGSSGCPREDLDAQGFAAFIPKPVMPNILASTIARTWNKAQVADNKPLPGQHTVHFKEGTRILLAEDNALNQEVARELLSDMGLEVHVVDNGHKAVEAARSQHFDLILMDIQMPVMDGMQATRSLRQLPTCASTPVIAMTANAFAEDRALALGAGMNDHVPKPVDPDHLNHILAKWLPQAVTTAVAVLTPTAATKREPTSDVLRDLEQRLAVITRFDSQAGLKPFRGDAHRLRRMLTSFSRDHAKDAAEALQELQSGQSEAAQRRLHTLKGLAATTGLPDLQAMALGIELAIKSGTPVQELTSRLSDLDRLLSTLATGMRHLPDDTTAGLPPMALGELHAQMQSLRSLLARDSLDASDAFEALRTPMQHHHPAEAARLAQLIDDFSYQEALTVLDQVLPATSAA